MYAALVPRLAVARCEEIVDFVALRLLSPLWGGRRHTVGKRRERRTEVGNLGLRRPDLPRARGLGRGPHQPAHGTPDPLADAVRVEEALLQALVVLLHLRALRGCDPCVVDDRIDHLVDTDAA